MVYLCIIVLLCKVFGFVYDLNVLWELYCYYEFDLCDVDLILLIMVFVLYVNYVLIMMGGVGYDDFKWFYKYYFVYVNLKDMYFILILCIIGVDCIVDEFIFCVIYDCEIDWMLFGFVLIGKYIEILMLVVICFCGDKLYNEYIYWD